MSSRKGFRDLWGRRAMVQPHMPALSVVAASFLLASLFGQTQNFVAGVMASACATALMSYRPIRALLTCRLRCRETENSRVLSPSRTEKTVETGSDSGLGHIRDASRPEAG
jgi:hypothetical protein